MYCSATNLVLLYPLVFSIIGLNCFPKTGRTLNIIPVDTISKVIVSLTQSEHAFVTDLHQNPNYFIYELANQSQYEILIDDLLNISAKTEANLCNKELMQCVSYQKWK